MKTIASLFLLLAAGSRAADATPALPSDNFFDSGGTKIHYVEQGRGPPVLLIHGYLGTADRHWISTGVFANLAADHRVIALDCRGHGKSGKPHDPTAYGTEMGKDIVRLLDHLKISRAHIVGFSMGAIIVGHLLTTDADRFLSAALVGHPTVRRWTAVDEQEAEAAARDLESDPPFRAFILNAPRNAPPPNEDEIRRLSQTLTAANDAKALAAYQRGRRALAVTDDAVAAVRVPVLGIIGSADPSLAGMRDLKSVMPALSLIIVDGAEHGGERGVLRRPEFLVAFRAFLAARR